ncbi:tetratricopeptide repeat-containing sulfotransferase family protein [Magnetospira sp. QH-2]|uniref:tetratricopeptide repeat-containing sulfotransferase family protein n=1 Tax=Magnetospira sp. (strain QH-2) TaxID=1288970 RepID=UPI0003E81648|nr:tetratricopeptide repeat-containing sulfotransferase family protein [Magnetospira sp. QH-2]CCQ74844.1 putative Sulfotransferase with TPR repeats [Magnetospira sp. QH-2]
MENKQHPLTPEQALEVAGRHIMAGNRGEAAAICQKILDTVPNQADALHMLGGCAMLDGQARKAMDCFDKALEQRPDDPAFLANKGTLMLNMGLPVPATELLRKAVDLRTEMAPAWDSLGRALQMRESWEEALEAYQKAIEIDPKYARAHAHLASLYRHEGRGRMAGQALQQALKLNPENPDILAEASAHFIDGGFLTRARGFLEKALEADPHHPEALMAQVDFFEMAGRGEDARRILCGQVAHRPSAANLRVRLGSLLLTTGHREDAEEILRDLLEDMPNHPPALAELASMGALKPGDEETKRLEEVANRESLAVKQKASMNFALASIRDKAKDYDKAFEALTRANDLRHGELQRLKRAYDPDAQTDRMEQLKAIFDATFFKQRQNWGMESARPILIAGMPRSGTTLVEQIIAAHPKAAGAGELMDLPHLSMILPALTPERKPYPACLPSLTRDGALRLGRAYDQRLHDWAPKAEKVTNKLPGNYAFLGMAALLFPKATYIHCRRDAMDNSLSNFFANFQDGLAASFNLRAQGHAWKLYADLMRHWHAVLPVTVLDVDYEKLVADPEPEVRRLLDHCGLDWDPACLEFHKSHRAIRTASRSQVRNPIYQSSSGRWRRYENHLGDLIDELGGATY